MFPSQPQIGQDMARERQQLAARIRISQTAHPQARPKRWRALLETIQTLIRRPVLALRRPLRDFERGIG